MTAGASWAAVSIAALGRRKGKPDGFLERQVPRWTATRSRSAPSRGPSGSRPPELLEPHPLQAVGDQLVQPPLASLVPLGTDHIVDSRLAVGRRPLNHSHARSSAWKRASCAASNSQTGFSSHSRSRASNNNLRKIEKLTAQGLMRPAGIAVGSTRRSRRPASAGRRSSRSTGPGRLPPTSSGRACPFPSSTCPPGIRRQSRGAPPASPGTPQDLRRRLTPCALLLSVVSPAPLNLSDTAIRESHRATRNLRRGVITTMTGRQPQEPSGDGAAAGPSFEERKSRRPRQHEWTAQLTCADNCFLILRSRRIRIARQAVDQLRDRCADTTWRRLVSSTPERPMRGAIRQTLRPKIMPEPARASTPGRRFRSGSGRTTSENPRTHALRSSMSCTPAAAP